MYNKEAPISNTRLGLKTDFRIRRKIKKRENLNLSLISSRKFKRALNGKKSFGKTRHLIFWKNETLSCIA